MVEGYDAFIRLYSGLTREGPGTTDSLLRVVEMADPPAMGRVLDAGCGSGADSEILSRALPGVEIVGLDKQPAFIKAAQARGLRVDFQVGDMLRPSGMFDLIWCAGAAYFPGVEAALAAWRWHLNPGAKIAFSEVVWLTDTPRPAARDFWDEAYPEMSTLNQMLATLEDQGFRTIAADPLGLDGWAGYYAGLRANIEALQGQGAVMDAVIAETQAEIDVFDTCFPDYDYVVFLVELT